MSLETSTERELGDRWAAYLRRHRCWVQKLPASSLAGLPDWVVVEPGRGTRFVEAKLLRRTGAAFVPSQCTGAQRFFLTAVARHGGRASILVLGPSSWYEKEVEPAGVQSISRAVFKAAGRPYDG